MFIIPMEYMLFINHNIINYFYIIQGFVAALFW